MTLLNQQYYRNGFLFISFTFVTFVIDTLVDIPITLSFVSIWLRLSQVVKDYTSSKVFPPLFMLTFFFLAVVDPYLNVDAGTMSPFEHGEVYVLDDGGEVNRPLSYCKLVHFCLDCLLVRNQDNIVVKQEFINILTYTSILLVI